MTATGSASGPVEFTDAEGRTQSLDAAWEADEPWPPGSPVRVRRLRLAARWAGVDADGATGLLQKRVVPSTARNVDWAPYDALDREISIGLHLVRGCAAAGRPYPAELSRLVGYDVDAEEPFVLYLPYRGQPVSRFVGRLLLREQRVFETGVFKALGLLAAMGVTHRAIGPDTVLWDKETLQVQAVDFSSAVLSGTKHVQAVRAAWLHEQDAASSDPRVDVWSAGALAFYSATGRRLGPGDDPVAEPALQSSRLAAQLSRILSPSIEKRPTAAAVLHSIGYPDPWPEPNRTATAADELFAEGGRRFDVRFPPAGDRLSGIGTGAGIGNGTGATVPGKPVVTAPAAKRPRHWWSRREGS
ncbi:hypothetical protein ABH920_007886 [Catenulispora sp. EB89]|uniref:hypothetical protein n=1 Tax=Catenulispora sp. EB89 TaxID=3156257 RepID=UPI003517123C